MPPTLSNYTLHKKLGQGSFSTVYLATKNSTGETFALKQIRLPLLTSKEKQYALNEIRLLASLNDPCIVAYKEAFFDQETGLLHIVMEYMSGGSLSDRLGQQSNKLSFGQIWRYVVYLFQGLETLHGLRICHRDIKLANLFLSLDNKELKIGDFNVSKVAKQGYLEGTSAGTPYYLSPEIWAGEKYNEKCDIWAAGCVVYEMITNEHPFVSESLQQLCMRVIGGKIKKLPQQCPLELQQVVQMCLVGKQQERATAGEILAIVPRRWRDQIGVAKSEDYCTNEWRRIVDEQQLLKTIQMPVKMAKLQNMLPKAKEKIVISKSISLKKLMKKQVENNVKSSGEQAVVLPKILQPLQPINRDNFKKRSLSINFNDNLPRFHEFRKNLQELKYDNVFENYNQIKRSITPDNLDNCIRKKVVQSTRQQTAKNQNSVNGHQPPRIPKIKIGQKRNGMEPFLNLLNLR